MHHENAGFDQNEGIADQLMRDPKGDQQNLMMDQDFNQQQKKKHWSLNLLVRYPGIENNIKVT